MLLSPSLRPSVSAASGRPSTTIMTSPAASVAPSGMTSTGISPRIAVGTVRRLSQSATSPASTPPMMPPMKPEPVVPAMAPMTKPGAMPGRSAIA